MCIGSAIVLGPSVDRVAGRAEVLEYQRAEVTPGQVVRSGVESVDV